MLVFGVEAKLGTARLNYLCCWTIWHFPSSKVVKIFILKWCTVCLFVQARVRNKICMGSRVLIDWVLSGVKNEVKAEGGLKMSSAEVTSLYWATLSVYLPMQYCRLFNLWWAFCILEYNVVIYQSYIQVAVVHYLDCWMCLIFMALF